MASPDWLDHQQEGWWFPYWLKAEILEKDWQTVDNWRRVVKGQGVN